MLLEREVNAEINRGRDLHGPLSRDPARAALILSRETLEVLQEAAELNRVPRLSNRRCAVMTNLRAELVQVVAVAAQWVANLDMEAERDARESSANLSHTGSAVGVGGQGNGSGGALPTPGY